VRVVIAEDSIILRDGLIRLLTAKGHQVVAEAADATGLLPAVAEHAPDVAVVDVRMPPTHTDDGLRAAIDVRRHHPDVGILVFSQYVEVHHARRLFADDARGIGYLLKDRITEIAEFLTALERVAAGGSALDPEVVSRMLTSRRNEQGLARLTPRESDVLALMAEGLSNTPSRLGWSSPPARSRSSSPTSSQNSTCRHPRPATAASWRHSVTWSRDQLPRSRSAVPVRSCTSDDTIVTRNGDRRGRYCA
jgi:DNA-binding NarL/FixJ family response regulator